LSHFPNVEQIVDHAIQLQRRLSLSNRDGERFWSEEAAYSLFNCGMLFKNTEWEYQREFRLLKFPRDGEVPFWVAEKPRLGISFDRRAILGVVRGPKADLTAERIRDVMRKAGYHETLPIVDAEPI
jgi:hypothetical protein